jgi:cysteine desulfurase
VAEAHVGMSDTRILRDRFHGRLREIFGDLVTLNGHPTDRLPNTLNVNFVGRSGAEVISALPGVAASTGSACHAGSISLSPVLAAMGVPSTEGMGAVRFSLGRTTTWEELEYVLLHLSALKGDPARSAGRNPQP